MPNLALTPIVAETMARILRTPGVVGLQIEAGVPVEVGVRREHTGIRWFHGRDLATALDRACDGIQARVVVEEDRDA